MRGDPVKLRGFVRPRSLPFYVVLLAEPDVTFLMRLENMLLAPFVPEQQL